MSPKPESSFEEMGPVLAEGSYEGEKWQFRASVRGDACQYGMETSLGGGFGGARFPFDDHGFGQLGYFGTIERGGWMNPAQNDRPKRSIKYVVGVVHPSAADIIVDTTDGMQHRARTFQGDDRVSFFFALIPSNTKAEAVRALNADGVELERQSF